MCRRRVCLPMCAMAMKMAVCTRKSCYSAEMKHCPEKAHELLRAGGRQSGV